MLTLFILESGSSNADPEKALKSFGGLVSQAVKINSLSEVNQVEKENEWYFVIYDDEFVDNGLIKVPLEKDGVITSYSPLAIYMKQSKAEALIIYKKKGSNLTRAPRMFRKYVKLSNTLLPANKVTFDTILDGWIRG